MDPMSLLSRLGVWDIQQGQVSSALPVPPRGSGDSSLQVVLGHCPAPVPGQSEAALAGSSLLLLVRLPLDFLIIRSSENSGFLTKFQA